MSSGGNAARLAAITRDLMDQWSLVRDVWNDAQSRQFEEQVIRELDSAVNAATQRIQTLESFLSQIRRDCE